MRDDPRLFLAPGDAPGSGGGPSAPPVERERIGVTRLTLTDFRSYARMRMEADLRPVVLTGPNGAGKTNLLEALSFLAPGRGLRRAKLSEITREGAAGGPQGAWAVAARVRGPLGEVTIGTGREAGESDRRTVHIDGEAARSQTQLGEFVTALWLTPDMDRLFQEGASARRRFLDRMVYGLDPDHAGRLNAYETAMRNRNRLMREGRMDRAWLDGLEDAMAGHGVAVAAARRDLMQRLGAALAAAEGPFPRAEAALDGVVESWLDAMPALEAEDRLRALLAGNRRRDAEAGVTAEGPHRTDLKVRHAGKNVAAERCSTGEQKAVLISLVLAQASVQADLRGMAPMLLLDEVAAHLDDARRRALFDRLAALGAQSWLTGTDHALFAGFGDRAQHFTVRDGAAVPAPLH
ncbi:DNA replication/repair protein RecF [Caenispirillum salinarum]|uniref:DNA replication/repair protein RecF n=1 Tax=Caenispirillum salinarum TaxID=859058 RepID=UPI0038512FEC